MALTLDDLFASPDHYLHSFEGDAALFMPMDREAYHRSIFLDGRIWPASSKSMRLPLNALVQRVPRPRPTSWIFHVAHCGSTLLARALDHSPGNLVLREPFALRQLAFQPESGLLTLVAAMLSKRYHPDKATVVKANVPVNFLLGQLAAIDPNARAIFLHCSLRDYLLAILRSDNHREWMRAVTTQLARYLGDVSTLPDAERGASLWLAQMRAFGQASARLPNGRSLDAETFFGEPREVLGHVSRHLEVAIPEAELDALVAGPLFSTYSKNPEMKFDNEMRLERRRALEETLAPEIAQAQAWIEKQGNGVTAATEALARVRLA